MNVLGRIVTGHGPVPETGGDDRNFAFEGDEAFKNQRHATKRCKRACEVFASPEEALSLAVITHATGFQHTFAAKGGQRGFQLFLAIHGAEIGGWNAAIVEEAFFRQAIL